MAAGYSEEERREIVARLREGGTPECPACGEGMSRRRVPPKDEVAYVRDRIWLLCPGCRRSVLLERGEA